MADDAPDCLVPIAVTANPATPDEVAHTAEALRNAGQPEAAAALLQQLLAHAPDSFGAHAGLGHIARARGDHQAALAHFEAALALQPGHAGALCECGAALLALGELDEAEQAFGAALRQQPQEFGALAGLGHLARQRGDRAAALVAFTNAAAAYPDNPDLASETATELRALGRLAEAGAIYERFVADAAENFDALVALAHLARQRGDRAASLARFTQARALRTDHVGVMLEIADDLAGLNRPSEAEAVLREVLARAPQTMAAQIRLGHLARRRGDRAAAMACFAGAVAADPLNHDLRLEIATELRDAERVAEAREIVNSVLKQVPGHLPALLQAAQCERAAGDRPAALAALRHALTHHPQSVAALVECAIEERVAGDPAASAQLLARAHALAPGDLAVLLQRAEHAWLADDPAAALAACEEAMRQHPTHPLPPVQVARALAALGQPEAGLALLATAAGAEVPHPDLVARQAELLGQLGRWAEALALVRAHPEAGSHFALWRQSAGLAVLLGDTATATAVLAAPPAHTRHERADACVMRGESLVARWDLPGAAAQFAAAIELDPANGLAHRLGARTALLQGDLAQAARLLTMSVRLDHAAIRLRRQSANASQTMLGHILNEFAVDAALARQVRQIATRAPGEQVAPLLGLMREDPGKTITAIALLLALRQSGALQTAPGDAPARIPRRIAQYWDTAQPPADVGALMAGWRAAHPDYVYTQFSDASARAFLAERFSGAVLAAYRRAHPVAQKANIFRLAWLYAEGGVYVDADDRCLGPVEAVLDSGLVTCQEEHGALDNHFLAALPRHAVIGRALADGVIAVNRGDQEIPWLATGPALLTRAFAATLAEGVLQPGAFLAATRVLERHALRPMVAVQTALNYKRRNTAPRN